MAGDALEVFKQVADVVKTLITVSTGIVGLSITFSKDLLPAWTGSPTSLLPFPRRARVLLVTAWVAYLISILLGVVTLQTVTGGMHFAAEGTVRDGIYAVNIRVPFAIHLLSFLVATLLIVASGVAGMPKSTPEKPPAELYESYLRAYAGAALDTIKSDDERKGQHLRAAALGRYDRRAANVVRSEKALASEMDETRRPREEKVSDTASLDGAKK